MITIALVVAVLVSALALSAVAAHKSRLARREREAIVLFETQIDPPYLRPVFTARTERELLLDAPVVHARLASGVLHLTIRSDAGGEAVGFEVAITNVELDWLRGECYRCFSPEAQVLVGPLPGLTERLVARVARAHDLPADAGIPRHVQAYPVSTVTCDPAEDTLRVEVALPGGGHLRLAYDYAAATVAATFPTAALANPANRQTLAVRVAA